MKGKLRTPSEKQAAPKGGASNRSYGTGRRKNSIARVWIKPGKGAFTVNGKNLNEYFTRPVLQMIVNQPFDATKSIGQFDVLCTVVGGGLSGQAGALRHGLSRALNIFDVEAYHTTLRQGQFLTRNSKVVERKKYGRKKARKRFQFSKR
jgi:small subunit ribosomal protein S9